MPVLTRGGRSILFIHIPKTGGTSVEKAAEKMGWTLQFTIGGIRAGTDSFIRISPQHFHATLLEQAFRLDAFDRILAVCREPFARLKSEYYWQLQNRLTEQSPDRWIDDVLESARTAPSAYDNHLRPQAEFIPSGVTTDIFKLEESGVEKAIEHVRELGADSTLRVALRTKHKSQRYKASAYNCSVEDRFLERRAEIVGLYAIDYETFGYQK